MPRPQSISPRDTYIYYPNTTEVPESAAVNVRGRSFDILAEVELTDADAQGVIFAHGSRFGGHALFIKDHKLFYVYNFLGIPPEQKLVSNGLKPGKYVLGMEFKRQKAGTHGESLGRAKLYINKKVVAEADMRTQPAFFALCGEGLCVGRDSSDAVSHEYGRGLRVHRRRDQAGRGQHRQGAVPRPREGSGGDDVARIASASAARSPDTRRPGPASTRGSGPRLFAPDSRDSRCAFSRALTLNIGSVMVLQPCSRGAAMTAGVQALPDLPHGVPVAARSLRRRARSAQQHVVAAAQRGVRASARAGRRRRTQVRWSRSTCASASGCACMHPRGAS